MTCAVTYVSAPFLSTHYSRRHLASIKREKDVLNSYLKVSGLGARVTWAFVVSGKAPSQVLVLWEEAYSLHMRTVVAPCTALPHPCVLEELPMFVTHLLLFEGQNALGRLQSLMKGQGLCVCGNWRAVSLFVSISKGWHLDLSLRIKTARSIIFRINYK